MSWEKVEPNHDGHPRVSIMESFKLYDEVGQLVTDRPLQSEGDTAQPVGDNGV